MLLVDMYWARPASAAERAADKDAGHFLLNGPSLLAVLTLMKWVGMIDLGEVEKELARASDMSWEESLHVSRRKEPNVPVVTDADTGGLISLHKIDQGVLTTSAEITRSLANYDATFPDPDDQPRELPLKHRDGEVEVIAWWGEFIDWLRQAAEHGGFRVAEA